MRRWILSISLLFLPFTLLAQEQAAPHEYILKNGLKLIVKQDHRAPVVVSQIWYKIGSSYEHSGITGISHVLEHMMFKGTKKHPSGEFSRLISENGGRENAFTGDDYTAYFQQLEKSRLAVSFRLEADRMRNLTLPNDEFLKEVRVVMEERRLRTDDKPKSLTYEQFIAAAYINSPYHNPVIGWMNDLENLEINDLKQWYQMWYAPNNATLIVVGDVEPDKVYRLAKKYFGRLKPSKLTPPKPRLEAEQKGLRRIIVKAPAQLPYLIMGYKVPVLTTSQEEWEPYALDVLAGILDGGASARIAKDLIRDTQIAASAGAGYDMTARLETLFMLDGTPAQSHTIAELEAALRKQIQRLREEPVTPKELARIKAQVVASNTYQLDSVFYQAMQVGTLETVGLDWRLLDEYVDRIHSVTPEQVQAVAKKYLIEDRLTIAELVPLPIETTQRQLAAPAGGGHGH